MELYIVNVFLNTRNMNEPIKQGDLKFDFLLFRIIDNKNGAKSNFES